MLTSQSDSVELYHALCDATVNFSKALDACKEYRKELDEKNNEVARLRELLDRAMDSLSDERLSSHRAEAEVARLRELLNRAIEIAKVATEYIEDPDRRKHYRSQIQQLAPALEEPSPRCEAGILSNDRCKNKATLGTDTGYKCCEHHAPSVNGKWRDDVVPLSEKTAQVSDKEPAPEWRELGEDEVIQEGDEVQWPKKDWQPAKSSIGYKVGYWDGMVKARTRRPLPVQQEMPLEKEIKYLETGFDIGSNCVSQLVGWPEIAKSLRYLRAEVQKLKEAR